MFGVMAAFALLLFAGAVLVSTITWRTLNTRFLAAAILASAAIAAAIGIRSAAARIARALEIDVAYVDPGLLGYLAPPLFAAFAFVVGRLALKGAWTGRPALLFYVWLLIFTATNIINFCSSGWCGTFGFPLTWYAWSDLIFSFDNDHFSHVRELAGHVTGGVLNLLTFVVVALLLGHLRTTGRSA